MKLDLVVGARPNFMKIAPLRRALADRGADTRLVHTGQHYDERMSEVFFRQLGLPAPDLDLGVDRGSHARQTAAIMVAYEEVALGDRPDLVVVVGDVNSTLACALVASKLHIPVAHVEAGLRSGDRRMPEEINRIVTDALSDLLFVTEEAGVENLRREGVPESAIHLVGNVMIDTLVRLRAEAATTRTVEELGLEGAPFALATFHRPANVDEDEPLGEVVGVLRAVARHLPVAFPVHPRTRQRLTASGLAAGLSGPGIRMLEPQGYLQFLHLMEHASVVVTDSGGIQEETTFLGTPCLTVRETTERPVTVTHGTNELMPLDAERVAARVGRILGGDRPAGRVPPLWDGRAAERIADILLSEQAPAANRGSASLDAAPR